MGGLVVERTDPHGRCVFTGKGFRSERGKLLGYDFTVLLCAPRLGLLTMELAELFAATCSGVTLALVASWLAEGAGVLGFGGVVDMDAPKRKPAG